MIHLIWWRQWITGSDQQITWSDLIRPGERVTAQNNPAYFPQAEFGRQVKALKSALGQHFPRVPPAQQVFEPACRSPGGEDYKRISLTGIGPSAWKISYLPILGVIKHPPLAPTQAAIDKLKFPPEPRMKRVGNSKILF